MARLSKALPSHLTAGAAGLSFAYMVSATAYMTTGIQFIAPLALILLTHLTWIGLTGGFQPGYSALAISRTAVTANGLVVMSLFAAVVTPMPAEANVEGYIGGVLAVLLCLLMVAAVLAAFSAVILGVSYAVFWAWRSYKSRKSGPQDPGTGVNDLGMVVMVLALIGAASFEGVPAVYSFAVSDRASRTVDVAADPMRVWQEVAKATSPSFPLPLLLKSIPQPVAIVLDEGAQLGARRIVRFQGREGQGELVLQVTRRTETEVVFTVIEDTSPIGMWVRQSSITFRVEPAGDGTRLTVTSYYDRLLAPAWFFRPYVRIVSFVAVDVLARDTRDRSQTR
jgi:hypothetical protein